MSRIFLDSSVIIYLIEGVSAFHVPVATAFQQASQQPAGHRNLPTPPDHKLVSCLTTRGMD